MYQFLSTSRILSFLFLNLCFVFCACDDEDVRRDDFFELGEEKFPITGGYLINYEDPISRDGLSNTLYRNELALYNKGITSTRDANGAVSWAGVGDILYLHLTTPYSKIEEGAYTWSSSENAPAIFTFQESGISLVDDLGFQNNFEFMEGHVVISKRGTGYEVHVTGVVGRDFDGDGNMEGFITAIEFDGMLLVGRQ